MALRLAELGLFCDDSDRRGGSGDAWEFAGSSEGSTGTTVFLARPAGAEPFARLLSCAPFSARSFEGDAIGPLVGRPGVEEGTTVGDCDATEFFLLRDRCRPGEP